MENLQKKDLNQVIGLLKSLPRNQKLFLIQYLASELAQQEGGVHLIENATYPIWTPLESYSASNVLEDMLKEPNIEID